MSTSVYSTRKPTKEILYMGITPMTVFTIEFAYQPTRTWPGDHYHAANMRMEGRVAAQALVAAEHHAGQGNNVAVWDGFKEGAPVYRFENGLIPSTVYDTPVLDVRCGTELIGHIYKVGGRWTIEQDCPKHDWNYEGCWRGNEPAKSCTRCGRFEYADAKIQAAHEETYPEAA